MTFRAIDPAVAKIYYAEEADRPISTLNIPDGSLVIFTDSGLEDSFDSVANAWFNREQITQASGGETAGLVVAELTNLANTLGLYTPARDVFVDWLYGQDGTYSATLTKGSANNGLPGDISEINPDARSIVIIAEDDTTLDYDYLIQFSRNGVDDWYTVASANTVSVSPNQIDLPASLGYDQYVKAVITPDAGQSDTNAQMKVYLTGRGG